MKFLSIAGGIVLLTIVGHSQAAIGSDSYFTKNGLNTAGTRMEAADPAGFAGFTEKAIADFKMPDVPLAAAPAAKPGTSHLSASGIIGVVPEPSMFLSIVFGSGILIMLRTGRRRGVTSFLRMS